MTRLRIGVRVHGGMSAARCVALAKAAETQDFHSLWFAENPFNRGILPAMSAAALATTRLGIGIGVFNPYNRHPTLIAMETGALDELAGGRVSLGIGSGIGTRVMQMGLSYDKPLAAMRDAVTITRGMLRGESVVHEGTVFSAKDARLEFTPPRPDMPVFVAAMGEGALKLTGQVGDGLMISNLCPPSFATYARSLMTIGATKAGRATPETIIQYVPCIAGPNGDSARREAKKTIGAMLSAYWALYARWPATKTAMLQDSGILESEADEVVRRLRAGEAPEDVLDARFVETYALAGTAADCRAVAARYAAAGVTELVLTFAGADPEADMAYVAPALKDVFCPAA